MKISLLPKSKTLTVSYIVLALFGTIILLSTLNKKNDFYDFRLYYFSVESYKQDVNYYKPLTKEHLNEINLSGPDSIIGNKIESMGLTYVYPPITIKFFNMLSVKNYYVSIFIFTLFKLLLLIALFWLWRKTIKIENFLLFVVFAFFAFDSTLFRDFEIGQITVIEQLFLWLGFYYFIKKKYLHFVGFILLASCFKLTPMFFLILLLFINDKKKYRYIALGISIFLLYIGLNFVYSPELFHEFVNTFSGHLDGNRIDGRSIYHPSLYIFIDTFFYKLSGKLFFPVYNSTIVRGAFIVIAIIIAYFSGMAIKKLNSNSNNNELYESDKMKVFLICLVYALLNPKFMCYSYIILIIPAYYLIQKITSVKPFYLLLFILAFAPSPGNKLPGLNIITDIVWLYLPVALSAGVWLMYIYEIHRKSERSVLGA